tara:strand:- start:2578 stop:4947 length:2370 start_codon:yes stop_codon:yes gene_type:complete
MDNSIVISVNKLNKIFNIYKTPSDFLIEKLTNKVIHEKFEALKDISFEVRKGEVVGIIGRNGAGKSTLLKIITGVLDKTSGDVNIKGKISAILELGSGFNAEYTGRQNIIMGGMCLGMNRKEVETKIESIIEFSELREVIDRPFKTFSSGMQARLTFSTAISVDPDILIVDEALATGDAAFVEKCLGRMEQIVNNGATVLLVTHNANLINRFGKRAIWIDNGEIILDGNSEKVGKEYELSLYKQINKNKKESGEDKNIGDGQIKILNTKIIGTEKSKNIFLHGKPLIFCIEIDSKIESDNANVGVMLFKNDGQLIWSSNNKHHLNKENKFISTDFLIKPGISLIELTIPEIYLNSGNYYINVYVEPKFDTALINDYHDWKIRAAKFAITKSDNLIVNKIFDSPSEWKIKNSSKELNQLNYSNNFEIEVLDYPYPYKSALSFSIDAENITQECYEDLFELFSKPNSLELNPSFSCFFYKTNFQFKDSISYFQGNSIDETIDADFIIENIRKGYIDTLHAYGDFDNGGFQREYAKKVLDICLRNKIKLPIWSNHGSNKNFQNIGHKKLTNYQDGDNPNSKSYHLDYTKKIGCEWFWVDDGIQLNPDKKEEIIYKEVARDGSELKLFKRYRGLIGREAPNCSNFDIQLPINLIDKMIENNSCSVIYQHFGVGEKLSNGNFTKSTKPYFSKNSLKIFEYLSKCKKNKSIFIDRASELLKYIYIRDNIEFKIKDENIILSSKIKINSKDLKGISFRLKINNFKGKVILESSNDYKLISYNFYSESLNSTILKLL